MPHRWAYYYEVISSNKETLIDRLKALGEQGWELCGMLKEDWHSSVGYGMPCIFKRPGLVINGIDAGRL